MIELLVRLVPFGTMMTVAKILADWQGHAHRRQHPQ
jgi:hypothetical protein